MFLKSGVRRMCTGALAAITFVLLIAASYNRYAAFQSDHSGAELGWCVALVVGALLELCVVASIIRKRER